MTSLKSAGLRNSRVLTDELGQLYLGTSWKGWQLQLSFLLPMSRCLSCLSITSHTTAVYRADFSLQLSLILVCLKVPHYKHYGGWHRIKRVTFTTCTHKGSPHCFYRNCQSTKTSISLQCKLKPCTSCISIEFMPSAPRIWHSLILKELCLCTSLFLDPNQLLLTCNDSVRPPRHSCFSGT